MNAYEATMRAAEQIERNPQSFDFKTVHIPSSEGCGTPGCAIGWVAHFMGSNDFTKTATCLTLGISGDFPDKVFYDRMVTICGGYAWTDSAALCAATLRAYAAKYLAPAKPSTPNWEAIATATNAYRPAERVK